VPASAERNRPCGCRLARWRPPRCRGWPPKAGATKPHIFTRRGAAKWQRYCRIPARFRGTGRSVQRSRLILHQSPGTPDPPAGWFRQTGPAPTPWSVEWCLWEGNVRIAYEPCKRDVFLSTLRSPEFERYREW
jgi:hypothetical protein